MQPGDPRGKEVVAILCSDLHLSQKPPLARSSEEDWFKAMARSLRQLLDLSVQYQAPPICSGDLFDRWNAPAELINFALANAPHMYALPGQHDLPNHSYKDIRRSAYWTLVEAGKIENIPPLGEVNIQGVQPIRLHGFPFGFPIQPLDNPHDLILEIAVVHSYWWIKNTGYHNAPDSSRVGMHKDRFRGYDVVVIGDNHTPWHCKVGDTLLWNNGGFMRRKIDEVDYQPSVGLLHADGTITRHFLDCSKDKFLEPEKRTGVLELEGMQDFIEEVNQLSDSVIDFEDALKRFCHRKRIHPDVRKYVLQAMEKK